MKQKFTLKTLLVAVAALATTAITQAQTVLSGGFEQCPSTTSLFGVATTVQTTLAGCNTNYGFSGTGNAFYAGAGLAGVQGSKTHTSPTAPEGSLSVGLGIDAVVSLKLSGPMVVGNYYKITLKIMNSAGSPAGSNGVRFEIGSSTSTTSFGTLIGTTGIFAPSSSFSTIEHNFQAKTTDDHISFKLTTFTGDPGIANANNIAFLDDVAIQTVTPAVMSCSANKVYLTQGAGGGAATKTYSILTPPTAPLTYIEVGSNSHGITNNSSGYNVQDNFTYGLVRNAGAMSCYLVKIDVNSVSYNLGVIAGLPSINGGAVGYNSGDMDMSGNLYVVGANGSGTTVFYKINVAAQTATSLPLSSAVVTSDIAFNPVTGLIYFQDQATAAIPGRFGYIDPATGTVTYVNSTGYTPNNFGAMWSDALGNVYGNNSNGGFYQFNLATGARTLLAGSTGTVGNDGSSCPTSTLIFPADLAITKTDGTLTFTPGTTTTYTIVASNNGAFGVKGATVADALPAGIPAANFSYTAAVSTVAAVPGLSDAATSTTQVVGTQTGAINDVVDLPVGTTVTYTVTVTIPASYAAATLTNTTTITAPTNITEANTANNTATDIDNTTILPIRLVSFTATKKDKSALLNWITASEQNNKGFYVQHSTDGINWNNLDFVQSKNSNSSSNLTYSYTHNSPTKNANFYRLNQVDFDGKSSLSNIANVYFTDNISVSIYPNPATDIINIQGLKVGNSIQIINAIGQVLISKTATQEQENISTAHLEKGIYFITITNNKTGVTTMNKITKE